MSGYQWWDGELPNGIPGTLGRKEDRAKDKAGFPLCMVDHRSGGEAQPTCSTDKSRWNQWYTHTHTQTHTQIGGDTEELGWYPVTEARAGELMGMMVIVSVYCMITTCQELSTLSTLCWRPSALAHVLRKSSDTGTIFIPVLWRRQCWPRRLRSLSREMQL